MTIAEAPPPRASDSLDFPEHIENLGEGGVFGVDSFAVFVFFSVVNLVIFLKLGFIWVMKKTAVNGFNEFIIFGVIILSLLAHLQPSDEALSILSSIGFESDVIKHNFDLVKNRNYYFGPYFVILHFWQEWNADSLSYSWVRFSSL